MWRRKALFVSMIFGGMVLMALIIPNFAKSLRMQKVATGVWGGDHIVMHVSPGSASLEYDCATGSITGPLALNRKGEFSWRGFHSPEHGGPVRGDEEAVRQPTTYKGTVHGDVMTLTVKRKDDGEDLGTFTLKRGSEGHVFKCR